VSGGEEQPGSGPVTPDEHVVADARLLRGIHARIEQLEALLAVCDDHWGGEDGVYRFYHQSFKVFHLQDLTLRAVTLLRELAPDRVLNGWFLTIVAEGTGKTFKTEDNRDWPAVTRPILEAYFHAHYFLRMAVRYGRKYTTPPTRLDNGWAAVLELYGIR